MGMYYNSSEVTGDWDSDVAGTDKPGNPLTVSNANRLYVTGLSARVVVDAETDTIVITGRWQVSNDRTNWEDASPPTNAGNVAIATGTAGADDTVTVNVSAPAGVYGAQFARYVLVNTIVTGAVTDTYAIGYSYRAPGFENF